jgi:hypothetical protein
MKRLIPIALSSFLLLSCGAGGGSDSATFSSTQTSNPSTNTAKTLYSAAAKTVAFADGDADCPTGGILVETGVDKNGNGTLEASEVSKAQKVCNGAVGATGATGPAGPTTLTDICNAIIAGGAQLPSFCPGSAPTYSLADLKGTWRTQKLQSINNSNGAISDLFWSRGSIVINASGVGNYTGLANSNNEPNSLGTGSMSISSDGIVTISTAPTASGTMSMDKNLIVFTTNTCSSNLCKGMDVWVKVAP